MTAMLFLASLVWLLYLANKASSANVVRNQNKKTASLYSRENSRNIVQLAREAGIFDTDFRELSSDANAINFFRD